jgi:hypothetical protein
VNAAPPTSTVTFVGTTPAGSVQFLILTEILSFESLLNLSLTFNFLISPWIGAVGVAVGVALGVAVGAAVGVAVGVVVDVAVGEAVGTAVGVAADVAVGVALGVAVGVAVGVAAGVAVGVAVGVAIGVAVGVGVGPAWATADTAPVIIRIETSRRIPPLRLPQMIVTCLHELVQVER